MNKSVFFGASRLSNGFWFYAAPSKCNSGVARLPRPVNVHLVMLGGWLLSQEGVWFVGSSFSAFSLSSTSAAALPLPPCGGSLGHLADAVSGVYDCAAQNGDMAAANGEGTRDDIPETAAAS